jgi:hypothetical protein
MEWKTLALAAVCVIVAFVAPICARADSPLPAVLIADESDPGSPFSNRLRHQIHATLNAEKARRYAAYPEFSDSGHLTGSDFNAAVARFSCE